MLADVRSAAQAEGMVLYPNKLRKMYLGGYELNPDVVFDVGVDGGTRWLYKTFEGAKFVLIDPQLGSEEAVRKRDWLPDFDFYATALGAVAGSATLHVPTTKSGGGSAMSSLLTRTDALVDSFEDVTDVEVPITPLDEISAQYEGRFGLKIDTEGFEAQVLKGGSETLQRCDFVILEMSVSDRFLGASVPSEIISLLARAGLELRDVLAMSHGGGKKGKPRHMDMLFTRWAA
jgi:FkbM family methyltransferase